MSDESSATNEPTIETLQNELIHFRDRVNFKINFYLDYSRNSNFKFYFIIQTNRYLRLRELLTSHSKDSTLVVM